MEYVQYIFPRFILQHVYLSNRIQFSFLLSVLLLCTSCGSSVYLLGNLFFLASSSYRDAIDDMKLLFPHGLCCPLSPILQDEGIHCPAIGVVVTESKSNRHSQNEGNGDDTAVNTINRDNGVNASTSECNENITVSPRRDIVNDHYQQPVSHIVNPPRSLKQTTCIVFPSCLVNEMGHDKVSKLVYVDMIRGLVTKCGFCPIAMKMVWFSAEEAGHFALMKECSGQASIK